LVVQGILKDKVKILASKQCDVTLKISVAWGKTSRFVLRIDGKQLLLADVNRKAASKAIVIWVWGNFPGCIRDMQWKHKCKIRCICILLFLFVYVYIVLLLNYLYCFLVRLTLMIFFLQNWGDYAGMSQAVAAYVTFLSHVLLICWFGTQLTQHVREIILSLLLVTLSFFLSSPYLYPQSVTDYKYTCVDHTTWLWKKTCFAEQYPSGYPHLSTTPTLNLWESCWQVGWSETF
jgi:hypothetical protein